MDAPACWATGEPRSIGEDVRRGVYKHGVPGYRGLGDVVLGSLPRGETLDITKYADGLGPGFRPGGVDLWGVTESDRIEDRMSGQSMRMGLETPALLCLKCVESAAATPPTQFGSEKVRGRSYLRLLVYFRRTLLATNYYSTTKLRNSF